MLMYLEFSACKLGDLKEQKVIKLFSLSAQTQQSLSMENGCGMRRLSSNKAQKSKEFHHCSSALPHKDS